MSPDQMLMAFLEDESKKPEAAAEVDAPPVADTTSPKKRAPRTNKLSDSLKGLPTQTREIIAPEVLADPEAFRLIGEEISERLHVSPACFTVVIIKRLTHVRKNDPDAVPVTPALEPCLLPGSVLTPSLGAYLLTQKFCYHSTFYREQWKLKAAHGIELTRNLMCSWHDHLADRLLPLYDLIAASFRTATYVKIGETPVRCLQPGLGKTALGQFWAYHHVEHGPLFDWHKIGGVASRPAVCSVKRWSMPLASGRILNRALWTARSNSTITTPKTPSVRSSSATRIGCLSEVKKPAGAAL